MQMVGAFAEFERAMIRERASAGLAARAEGRTVGAARSWTIPREISPILAQGPGSETGLIAAGKRSYARRAWPPGRSDCG